MTKRLLAKMSRTAVVAMIACGAVSAARADHEILVTETGGPTIPIVDNGAFDLDFATPGLIVVNTAALNSLLVNFNFSVLLSASNGLAGAPFSNDTASLTINGNVARSTREGASSITIHSFDTNFLFPAGNPKTMTTAASDSFRFTTAADSRIFQSFFDPANLTPPGPGIASPLLAFIPPIGAGPHNSSNPGVDTPLGVQPLPFGISNATVITLGSSFSPTAMQGDQFSGTTTVHTPAAQVPEPAAVPFLLSTGVGAALAFGRSRRNR